MESPSFPDNRPHKTAFMAHTPEIVEPNDDSITKTQTLSVRSDSPPWQAYEPSAFGQPAIGRPPTGSKINGESSRRYSVDQESIVDSIGNQSLGHHSIGGQPDRQWQYGQHKFDQRSLSNLSLDQQSPTSPTRDVHSSFSTRSVRRDFVVNALPVLQQTNPNEGSEQFHPIIEENEEQSYDLVAPYEGDAAPLHSLERQADLMFCSEHMLAILNNPRYLAGFREFLHQERPGSLSTLTYYLNACKSLKAIEYANALVRLAVDVPTASVETAEQPVGPTVNTALEGRVQAALDALTAEELPAFITSPLGTAALAEVFCLTDPSRPDNPIIFASGEFHRTTQYGMDYVLGRNCRFLQGPKTNPNSVRRIREGIKAKRHHSELFLNYCRDGSPFMNLLQCAPLCDSHGKVRYFIDAQIYVSGLAMEGAQMESLQNIQAQKENPSTNGSTTKESKSEFQELGELFSPRELQNVREHGGNLFQPIVNEDPNHRLFLQDSDTETEGGTQDQPPSQSNPTLTPAPSLSLAGVYKHYLLVRPYLSLRILFTSPSLQIPGMLQSFFLNRIGDSGAKRDNILNAMMAGRSVTARIKWVTKFNDQGRNRWIHCTPLLANNGQVGVWMVVVIDEEDEHSVRWTGNWPSNY
ncbi:PAS-associated [Penicillium canescens]|nr:PAS-associated [Penicillium canescens]